MKKVEQDLARLREEALAALRVNAGLTASEVARILRVPHSELARWQRAGVGPGGFRLPGRRRFRYSVEALLAWLEALENGSSSEPRTPRREP